MAMDLAEINIRDDSFDIMKKYFFERADKDKNEVIDYDEFK